MRQESWRRSSSRYQASLKGQLNHAARQETYRCKRQIEKVTQQGTQAEPVHGSLIEANQPEATQQPKPQNLVKPPESVAGSAGFAAASLCV